MKKSRWKTARVSFLLCILPFIFACTRNNGESSKFRIEFPDWQATLQKPGTATSNGVHVVRQPGRIMINISGPGIPKPIVRIWESEDRADAQPPTSFEFEVPRGENRIIQILVSTRDFYFVGNEVATTANGGVFYGDVTKSLVNPTENVEVTIQELNMGSKGEGVITGRWIDSSGNGPTGTVLMKFTPPNAPSMVVDKTEIHGGWFTFHAIEGAKFTFELENGQVIFSDFDLANPPVTWNEERLWIKVPTGYRNIYAYGGPVARRETAPYSIVLGYFGPGASGNKVCYTGESFPIDNLFLSADLDTHEQVTWSGSSPSHTTAGVYQGGLVTPNGECTGTWLVDWMAPTKGGIADLGEWVAGFRGAFQPVSGFSHNWVPMIDAAYNAETNKISLSWKYLPGTTGSGRITGVEVFTRILTSGSWSRDIYENNGIACNHLMEPTRFPLLPFTSRGRFSVLGNGVQTAAIGGITEEDLESGRAEIILCPYSDNRPGYFTAGAVYRKEFYGGENGGPSWSELRLGFSDAGSYLYNNIEKGVCADITLAHVKDGILSPVADTLEVNLTNTATYSFYAPGDSECSGDVLEKITIPKDESTVTLKLKALEAGVHAVNTWAANISGHPMRVAIIDKSSYLTSPRVKLEPVHGSANLDGIEPYVIGSCYPLAVNLYAFDPYASRDVLSNKSVYDITLAAFDTDENQLNPMPGDFFAAPDCTGSPLSSVNFPSTIASIIVYFKPNSPSAGVYKLRAHGEMISSGNDWKFTTAPAQVAKLDIRLSGQSYPSEVGIYSSSDSCFEAYVQAKATNGAPVPLAQTLNVTLDANNTFKLSKNPSCSNASSAIQVNIGPHDLNSRSEPFWIKLENASNASGTITASTPNLGVSSENTLLKQPTIEVSGLPTQLVTNACYETEINLKANGSLLSIPADKQVTVNAILQGYMTTIFTKPNCESAAGSEVKLQFTTGPATQKIWVRVGSSDTIQFDAALMINQNMKTSSLHNVQSLNVTALVNDGMPISTGHICVPLQFNLDTSLPEAATIQNIHISGSVIASSTIYLDAGCTTSISEISIAPGALTTTPVYFKPATSFADGSYQISFDTIRSISTGFDINPVKNSFNGSCSSSSCNQPN